MKFYYVYNKVCIRFDDRKDILNYFQKKVVIELEHKGEEQ